MILLSGHSLTQARKIPLESLSLRLSERESTASMIPVTMDGIGTDSWLVDDTEPGRGIVWRVRSIQTAYATNTPTVQLEHVISCLKDRILFGSYGPSDMGGHDTATAEQAIRFILKRQSDWRLGKCEYNFSAPYKFDGENLYDALAKVTETLDESWWDLDTSVYPFVINVIKKPSGTACELRPGRNLSAISRTIDTSGMYTRFYPVGDDDLHIKTEYIGKNESTYGIREKVEVDQALTTQAELTSWAREKLRKHAQPVVNITAEGVELAAATGESLDKLTLGRKCRVPLQEFGTIIEERITQLEYTDKVREPEKVRITMSNARTDRDILHLLADELKNGGGTGGKGSRTRTKKSKEDHAWFEDTDKHVAMVAKGIIGTDASGKPNWERLSRLEVNEDGIYGEVKTVQNGLVLANTRIDQTEDHITLEANKFAEGQAALSARITVEADKISTEVANKTDGLHSEIVQTATSIRTEVDNKTEGLHSEIVQTATQIRGEVSNTAEELQASIDIQANRIGLVVEGTGANAKIRPAQIVASINNATKTSSVLISADRVKLSGTTTIDDVMTVANNYVHINSPLMVSSGDSGSPLMYVNGVLYVKTIAANSVETPYHLTTRKAFNVVDAQVSGNTLKITYVDGTTVNFSKAATLGVEYGGDNQGDTATYTVTGSPAGIFPSGNVVTGSFTVKQSKTAAYIQDPTGTIRARINNPQYGNGWAAAYGKVSLPTSSSTATSFDVKTPPASVDGSASTETYKMSSASNNIAVVKNKAGTVVARLKHDKYDEGKDAGRAEAYAVDASEIDGGSVSWDSGSIAGRKEIGDGISRPDAHSYIKFSMTVRGTTRLFYITVN